MRDVFTVVVDGEGGFAGGEGDAAGVSEGIFLPGGGQQRFCLGGQVPALGHFAFQAGVVVLALKGQCDAEQVLTVTANAAFSVR